MQNRRSSFSSSTASSLAKRQAAALSENDRKAADIPTDALGYKKRAPLSNLTNQRSNRNVAEAKCKKTVVSHSTLLQNETKIQKNKRSSPSSSNGSAAQTLPRILNSKSSAVVQSKNAPYFRIGEMAPAVLNQCSSSTPVTFTPARSDDHSVSMDDTVSSCESFKSPDVEYIDNGDVSGIDSVDRKAFSNLFISDNEQKSVNICNRDAVVDSYTKDVRMVDIDDNYMDPQLCATIACDIYKHLRASEMKKRPSTDFMKKIQKDINESMRAILIDWLVEVAEEYRLVPETLYLTVNYVDRYLSGNPMNRQQLQLLGVASMMIASKYEEICAPQVEEFCYITDNTYFKEEVLQMESDILNYLKFELTAPTPKCFLRRFVRVAQASNNLEVPSMQLECLANYIAELSLLEYSMLHYAPSLVSASAVFLAKFMIDPSIQPWDSILQHYTLYQPSDLSNCVQDLHRLCLNKASDLPAVREKYSQHKYKYVAMKRCPALIPREYFESN